MSVVERERPGAVWVVCRPGSRSGNRIILRTGRGPGHGYCGPDEGIYYKDHRGTSWCTYGAWMRWVKKHDCRFSHVNEVSP